MLCVYHVMVQVEEMVLVRLHVICVRVREKCVVSKVFLQSQQLVQNATAPGKWLPIRVPVAMALV